MLAELTLQCPCLTFSKNKKCYSKKKINPKILKTTPQWRLLFSKAVDCVVATFCKLNPTITVFLIFFLKLFQAIFYSIPIPLGLNLLLSFQVTR